MTKGRIITLSVLVIGIAATIYALSVASKNFAILAVSPLLLGFLACPLMCGVMGAVMWVSRRPSRNKQEANLQKNHHGHDDYHINHYYANNRISGNGKSSGKYTSTEPKSNNESSPNLNPPQPTSNRNSKIHPE